jgi:hypothetical protein
MEKLETLNICIYLDWHNKKWKIYFFTILAILVSKIIYCQIDTSKNIGSKSFEDYKKIEEQKFSAFKQKREKEIKAFISDKEDWNLITVGKKGNVELVKN